MKHTFLDQLNIVTPNLQHGLLNEGYASHLAELCSLLPYDIAQDFGFETRLGNPEAVCDFFLQIRKGTPGALMLEGKSNLSNVLGQLLEDPFWQRYCCHFAVICRRFAGRWVFYGCGVFCAI